MEKEVSEISGEVSEIERKLIGDPLAMSNCEFYDSVLLFKEGNERILGRIVNTLRQYGYKGETGGFGGEDVGGFVDVVEEDKENSNNGIGGDGRICSSPPSTPTSKKNTAKNIEIYKIFIKNN